MRMFGLAAVAALLFSMAPSAGATSSATSVPPCGNFSMIALVSPTSGGSIVLKRDHGAEEEEFTIDFVNGTLFMNGIAKANYDQAHDFEASINSFGNGSTWTLDVTVTDLDDSSSVLDESGVNCGQADSGVASAATASVSIQ